MRARAPRDHRHGPERGGSPPGIPGFVGAADRSAGCGRRDGRRLQDRTADLLRDFAAKTSLPFRWAVVSGNRSRGRNEAVRMANADVIAVTDVSVLEPTWFERIVAPIERGDADIVAGWFELFVHSPRERVIGLLTQWSRDQVRPATFLASSRSFAFTHSVWARAGGYPEAFAGNEDTIFDLAVERLRPRKGFVPDAVVRW